MRNPQFTPLDLQTWKRGQMFYYFAKMAPTGYSLTVDVDITRMRAVCKETGIKFFPAYVWLVTECLNRQTEFREDFEGFYRVYLDNQARFGDNHGVLCQNHAAPPENAYTVSCVPWISFRGFSVHSYGDKPYYFPSVEAGRYYERGGKILMPMSITCHHASTDGYHVKCFLEAFQEGADHFDRFLPAAFSL